MKKPYVFEIIMLYSIFIVLWLLIATLAYFGFVFGVFSSCKDYFGTWSIGLGIGIAVLTVLSPTYLRLFIKRERIIALTSIVIAVILFFQTYALSEYAMAQFNDFTPERWAQFPRQRDKMIDDLENKHNIFGKTANEVASLLGQPLRKDEYRYTYDYDYGIIEIIFKNGKVDFIDVTDYF